MTPLHYAADRGHTGIASLLMNYHADINAMDNELQTPIMYAVTCSNKVSIHVTAIFDSKNMVELL